MKGRTMKKVAGGKLLVVDVDYGDAIRSVRISGDFFLYPEEAITVLESALSRLSSRAPSSAIRDALQKTALKNKIQPVGFTFDDLAETVQEALL